MRLPATDHVASRLAGCPAQVASPIAATERPKNRAWHRMGPLCGGASTFSKAVGTRGERANHLDDADASAFLAELYQPIADLVRVLRLH